MMKKLRWRITSMLSLLIGVILIAVLLITLWLGIQQTKSKHLSYFDNAVWQATMQATSVDFENKEKIVFKEAPYYAVYINMALYTSVEATAISMQVKTEEIDLVQVEESTKFETEREILFERVRSRFALQKQSFDILPDTGAVEARVANEYGMMFYNEQNGEYITENTDDANKEVQESYVAAASEPSTLTVAETIAVGSNYIEKRIEGDFGEEYRVEYLQIFPSVLYGDIVQNFVPEEGSDNNYVMGDDVPIRERIEYEIIMVGSLEPENAEIKNLILLYIGIAIVGLLLLVLGSWFLAGIVISPVAEGVQKRAEFMAAASHELRTPLAVITSSLSAAESEPQQDEAQRYYSTAKDEAQRMGRLVSDMLTLARSDASRWDMSLSEVDIDTLLIETREQFMPLAKEQNKKVELVLPQHILPTVRGDANRLRQALTVLVDNALQYTPEGTEITLLATVHKNKLFIDVADQGEGVAEEDRSKVFDRFYRADKSRTDESHFGLGLAIAKDLCELNAGTLTVHRAEGGGALFRISLPVKSAKRTT